MTDILDFVPSKCWVDFKCLFNVGGFFFFSFPFPPINANITPHLFFCLSFTFYELSTILLELNFAFWVMSKKNEPMEFLLIWSHQSFNYVSQVFRDVSFHDRRAVNTCKVIISTKCCWPGIWIYNCFCHLLIVLFESLISSYTFTWHLHSFTSL